MVACIVACIAGSRTATSAGMNTQHNIFSDSLDTKLDAFISIISNDGIAITTRL